jgi:hypothetical protein
VINLEVAPEVSSIDRASVVINNLRVPGFGPAVLIPLSFATEKASRWRADPPRFPGHYQAVRSSARSRSSEACSLDQLPEGRDRTGDHRHAAAVRPVRAAAMKVPTDRGTAPDEVDLFLLGRPDGAVGEPLAPTQPSPVGRPIGEPTSRARAPRRGMAALDPSKLEKDYGHAF